MKSKKRLLCLLLALCLLLLCACNKDSGGTVPGEGNSTEQTGNGSKSIDEPFLYIIAGNWETVILPDCLGMVPMIEILSSEKLDPEQISADTGSAVQGRLRFAKA